jgi:hypothetical protein
MQPWKPSRDERERELCQLSQTPQGRARIAELFTACFSGGAVPARGTPKIETILCHEYGPPPTGRASS